MKTKMSCLEEGTDVNFFNFFTCAQRNFRSYSGPKGSKLFVSFSGSNILN